MKTLKKFTIRHLRHVESLTTEEIRNLLVICEKQLAEMVEEYTPAEDDPVVNGHICHAMHQVEKAIEELKQVRIRVRSRWMPKG